MKWTRWTGMFATTLGCIITYSHPGSFALHFPMYPIQILLLTFKAVTDWQPHIFQTSSFPWPVLSSGCSPDCASLQNQHHQSSKTTENLF